VIEFRLLGPLEVAADGRLLPIGSGRPRALLAALLLDANRVVPRPRLIDALWGDHPPERAANALQVYVSQLRKVIGRDRIETRPSGYLIHVDEGELDLGRFLRLVEDARESSSADSARGLREALQLWRGPPFADLGDLPFVEAERRRLDELRLSALERRVEADIELGLHADVVAELESLVHEHPLRERVRGQLMLALYRSGRQAEALEVYRSGRRIMIEELGLEPGETLRRLERAILAQDESLAAPQASTPPRVAARAAVPTGTVTLLITDIERSTRLVNELGSAYGTLLEQHRSLLRAELERHGGLEIERQADAFLYAFRRARDAVSGGVALQRAGAAAVWPQGATVKVRIGIHTGEPALAAGGYHGLEVVRAARISAAAHGGQILVSGAARELVGDALPEVSFVDLGAHELRGVEQPQRIFQAVAPGLRESFPPLRSVDAARVLATEGREDELAAAAQAAVGAEERRVRVFRRSRLAALIGAVLVAGAAAGMGLALTSGSPATRVAANSVAVLDPLTGRLVGDVPVGQRPVAIAADESAVWVANADDETVSRIDPHTRKVVATIGVGADVSDVAVGFGAVWVADGNDGTVTRIDPKSNGPAGVLSVGRRNSLEPNPVFSIAAGLGSVWITRGNAVVRIDPGTGSVTASFPVPAPVSMAVGDGALWVGTQDERLLRLDPRAGKQTGVLALPAPAAAIAVSADGVWVALDPGEAQVWHVDPSSMAEFGATAGCCQPIALARDSRSVWVALQSGAVWRIDRRSDSIGRLIRIGLAPQAVAVDPQGVWVAIQAP
jgi:YVTN family beta-propeller protein